MTFSYENVSDTVLYDIFYEAGTRLIGTYVAHAEKADAQNDETAFKYWLDEINKLDKQRRSVKTDDRSTQIKYIKKWNKAHPTQQQTF